MRDGGGGEGGAGDGGRVRHMSAAVLIAEGNHVNSGLATGPDYPRLTQREVPSHSRKTSSKPKKKEPRPASSTYTLRRRQTHGNA